MQDRELDTRRWLADMRGAMSRASENPRRLSEARMNARAMIAVIRKLEILIPLGHTCFPVERIFIRRQIKRIVIGGSKYSTNELGDLISELRAETSGRPIRNEQEEAAE